MTENARATSKDETNRDKALRGVAVKVSERRLAEMRTQAIRNEGIAVETIYHWHWAAAINELVESRAEIERLRAALLKSVEVIQVWHNFGMTGAEASQMWDIYWRKSPEMKPIREALASSSAEAAP